MVLIIKLPKFESCYNVVSFPDSPPSIFGESLGTRLVTMPIGTDFATLTTPTLSTTGDLDLKTPIRTETACSARNGTHTKSKQHFLHPFVQKLEMTRQGLFTAKHNSHYVLPLASSPGPSSPRGEGPGDEASVALSG